ncbi:MAG: hypothetical protein N2595_10745 [bacterium]|nr:hypothetical protein [bacterium]
MKPWTLLFPPILSLTLFAAPPLPPSAEGASTNLPPLPSLSNGPTAPPTTTAAVEIAEEAPVQAPEEAHFSKPSPADIANAIRALSATATRDQVIRIAATLGWDLRTSRDIDDFFQLMRAHDHAVLQRGNSVTTKRVLELARRVPYTRKSSQHFLIIYPRTVSAPLQGKIVSKPFEEAYPVDPILAAADAAFRKTTDLLLMSRFMNWAGKVRGRIYLIADPAEWNLIKRTGMSATPVQIVLTEDDTREFFVFVNPMVKDMLEQAVSFAVAELVMKEYAAAVAKQQRARLPVFFVTGLAGEVSGLTAVITEQGPQQVKRWKDRPFTAKDVLHLHRRFSKGAISYSHPPLVERQLNSFDRVVELTSYPRDEEQIFYHLLQSRALVRYLHEHGALPFVVLSKELAQGKIFERAFDGAYARVRLELIGETTSASTTKRTPVRAQEQKSQRGSRTAGTKEAGKKPTTLDKNAATPDEVLKSYRNLRNYARDTIFLPLTEEYMRAQAAQAQ